MSKQTREMLEVQMMALKLFQQIFGSNVTEEGATSAIEQYPELGWLAICLQRCPVPASWSAKRDGEGPVRFVHSVTGESTEDPPHLDHFVRMAKLMMMWRKKEKAPKDVATELKLEHEKFLAESVSLRRNFTGPHKDEIAGRDFWQNLDDEAVVSWVEPGSCPDFAARAALRLMQALPAPAEEEGQSAASSSSAAGEAKPTSPQNGELTPRAAAQIEEPMPVGHRPRSRNGRRSVSLQPLEKKEATETNGDEAPMQKESSKGRETPGTPRGKRHAHGGANEARDGSATPRGHRRSQPPAAQDTTPPAVTEAAATEEAARDSQAHSGRPPSARGRPSSRKGRPPSARGSSSGPMIPPRPATPDLMQPQTPSAKLQSREERRRSMSGTLGSTLGREESGGKFGGTSGGKFGGTAVVKEVCQMVISAAVDEVNSSDKSDAGSPEYIAVEADDCSESSGGSLQDTSSKSDSPTPQSPSLLSVHKEKEDRSMIQAVSPIDPVSPSIIILDDHTSLVSPGKCKDKLAAAAKEEVPPQVLCFESNPTTPPRRQRLVRPVKCGVPQPLSARGHREQADVEKGLLSARGVKYAGNKGSLTARGPAEEAGRRSYHRGRPSAAGGA